MQMIANGKSNFVVGVVEDQFAVRMTASEAKQLTGKDTRGVSDHAEITVGLHADGNGVMVSSHGEVPFSIDTVRADSIGHSAGYQASAPVTGR